MCDAEILVVAKENVAMRAVAEHMDQLLPSDDVDTRRRVRRFCGGEEFSRQERQAYPFDVHPDHQDVAWPEAQVRLLKSGVLEPMRRNSRPWNSDPLLTTAVAFYEEGQQFGPLTEVLAALSLAPEAFRVWSGDIMETPATLHMRSDGKSSRGDRDFGWNRQVFAFRLLCSHGLLS